MTKILWHSNSPMAPTGYGQQTALFTPLLNEHHDVFISANYGIEAAPIIWNGIPVLPGLGGDHGNGTIPGHVNAVFDEPREGLVLTLYDTPVFDPAIFKHLNTACWAPVDHTPTPPAVTAFFRNSQAIPFAMSEFGMEQLAEFDPIHVPHGTNTDIYKPRESALREQMEIEDDQFLIGIVGANKGRPSRKSFQQSFEAFHHFLRKHEDAVLYVHTQVRPEFSQGEDIFALANSLEIPQENFRSLDRYRAEFAPPEPWEMAQLYSAFDVLLNPSMGEGFGVPILEAAGCGTPSIVTDCSAMPEVAGPGWKVKGRGFWTGQASWMAIPDVGEIVGALEEAHDHPAPKELATTLRQHALNYSHTKVFEEHLLPAIEEVQERIGSRAPVKVAA